MGREIFWRNPDGTLEAHYQCTRYMPELTVINECPVGSVEISKAEYMDAIDKLAGDNPKLYRINARYGPPAT